MSWTVLYFDMRVAYSFTRDETSAASFREAFPRQTRTLFARWYTSPINPTSKPFESERTLSKLVKRTVG